MNSESKVASLPAAGRTLDMLVAERVMGWLAVGRGLGGNPEGSLPDDWGRPDMQHGFRPVPAYSTDIAAAWKVVERLDEKWFVKIERRGDRREEGRYFERWACHLWPGDFEAEAETAPLAICLAALKAVAP